MPTMAELKKGKNLADLKKSTEVDEQVRYEIDLEKAASALLKDPVDGIEKADDDTDAEELAKSLTDRIDSIQTLLEKAEEDEDGRCFVTTTKNDPIALEFSVDVEKGKGKKKPAMKEGDEGEESGEETSTQKNLDDDAWPSDMNAGAPARRRKLVKGERVVSTDPSARRDRKAAVAKRRRERATSTRSE